MTLQEVIIVLQKYEVMDNIRKAFALGVYHLAHRTNLKEQNKELPLPDGITVRRLFLNLAEQLNELAQMIEKTAGMTIFDDSLGSRSGLSSLNKSLVETFGPALSYIWDKDVGVNGYILNIEVAKAVHEKINENKKTNMTEEELLNYGN